MVQNPILRGFHPDPSLLRVGDEKAEERFKRLDETIREYQKEGKGRAEAAASRIPFFRKKKFGKSGKKL